MGALGRLTPPQAWDFLQQNPGATLLDVRTALEYFYVGHPVGAVHIPWQEAPGWEVTPDFADRVRAALRERHGPDTPAESCPVLAICRSGKRSHVAAEHLREQGFREVYNVVEGFEGDLDTRRHRSTINGWRFHNLPWEQG